MSFKYTVKGSVGFGNVLETILKNKGIDNISLFLNPTETCMESELLLNNIEKARDCLVKHIKNNSNITIVVDCDVDGFTSASAMYQYIKKINPNINITFIIHDGKEHGLDSSTMAIIKNSNCKLLIIPDASSNDYKEHKILKDLGIDIIVLDHHLADKYSDNAIVVNNQMSDKVTDKAMTGVGIVYKFCKVLDTYYNVNYADDYLDLVVLGMIADSADLRNLQSRYLVNKGVDLIKNDENKNKFITELIKSQAYSMNNKVTIIGIAFYIAPLINSLIRIGTQEDKIAMFKAFINSDEIIHTKIRGQGEVDISIQDYVKRLCESSRRKQKKIVDENVTQMSEQIKKFNLDKLAILVCNASDTIDKNYTGLIANKLSSIYQRPCLLLRKTKDNFSGSGRGFDKSEIKDFNKWCIETGLFSLVEGHDNAFGASLSNVNIDKLYENINKIKYIDELIYTVDASFNDKTLNKTVIETIYKCNDVWGTTVEEPMFAIENIIVNKSDINLMGKSENTIKFTFHNIDFIKFNSSKNIYNDIVSIGDSIKFTVIGRFSINEYNGTKSPQILMEDFMFEKATEVQKFRF